LYVGFELPLLRNAQKRHSQKKKGGGEKGTCLPHLAAIWKMYVAFYNVFLQRPLFFVMDPDVFFSLSCF
jgi:hypothetical protein